MEKKSCCCAGEAETVNVNMETTGVTGAEATANTVTAETETPSNDAVCHCRHKHRTEKEEKEWEKLWKTFFTTIAIEQRKNPDCQRNHLPLRFRLLMTEFAAVQPCGDLEPKVR